MLLEALRREVGCLGGVRRRWCALAQEAELRARDLAQVREQLTRELAEDERLGLHSAR